MASRSRLTCFAALFLALPMIGCAHRPAPEQPAPVFEQAVTTPQPAPAVERTTDSWAERYLISKQLEAAQLRAAGLGADWDFIRGRVAEHLPPAPYPGQTPAQMAKLREAHVYSTTSFLVRIGYRARHLAHPEHARTLVRAANMGSWDEADALLLVSPILFVAELLGIDRRPDNSADLVYLVSEPIKSAPAKGTEFRYPIHGPAPTVSLRPGEPRRRRLHQTRGQRRSPCAIECCSYCRRPTQSAVYSGPCTSRASGSFRATTPALARRHWRPCAPPFGASSARRAMCRWSKVAAFPQNVDLSGRCANLALMDLDDLFPSKPDDPLTALAKQDLDPMSIDELHARIEALKVEIARVEAHIDRASKHRSAAEELFKKP